MKISEYNRHLASFEKFLYQHNNPTIINHYKFTTNHFKVYSNTKILKDLEILAKSMQKKGEPLDDLDKKKIYSVLYYLKNITKCKLNDKFAFDSKHSDAELSARLEQIHSLLIRLGIRRESSNTSETAHSKYRNSH